MVEREEMKLILARIPGIENSRWSLLEGCGRSAIGCHGAVALADISCGNLPLAEFGICRGQRGCLYSLPDLTLRIIAK